MTRTLGGVFLAFVLLLPASVSAQRVQRARPQLELRVDAATPARLEGGLGVAFPAGYYARVSVLAAGGASWVSDTARASGRVEGTVRFSLDPFAEHRWAPFGGAGVQVGCAQGVTCRPRLIARLGVEGPVMGTWRPAVELGLGGGVHVAVAWRRATPGRR